MSATAAGKDPADGTGGTHGGGRAEPAAAMPRAKTPVGVGLVPALGVLWAVALTALGAVGIRDALVHAGAVSGQPWIERALDATDNRSAADWMVPVAIGCVLAALWLAKQALTPRPRGDARLRAETGVFLDSGSLRRLAAACARDVDGVDTASAKASAGSVTVTATTTQDQAGTVQQRVAESVGSRLAPLAKTPRVRVRIQRTGGRR